MNEVTFAWNLTFIAVLFALGVAIYGMARGRSLVKKLIALTILGDAVNVLVVLIGYRLTYPTAPPILPSLEKSALGSFLSAAVDPLPQALVITAVVIGMAVNVLIAFAIIQIYRLYGTVDAEELSHRIGGEGA